MQHNGHRFSWLRFSRAQSCRNVQRIIPSFMPELKLMTDSEAESVLCSIRRDRPWLWITEFVLPASATLFLLPLVLAAERIGLALHCPPAIISLVALSIAGMLLLLMAVLPLLLFRTELRHQSRLLLRLKGIPLCLNCGYLLHIHARICAECGTPVPRDGGMKGGTV